MTEQEEKELWIQILQPLAALAVVNNFLASHPDAEKKLLDNVYDKALLT